MHELSIASNIVESLSAELADKPGNILAVRIDVGVLSGVVPDALQFAWEMACSDSRLAGSELQISEIQVVAHCVKCDADHTIPSPDCLRCPVCDGWTPDILRSSRWAPA